MMRPCHGRDPGSNEPFRKRLKPKGNPERVSQLPAKPFKKRLKPKTLGNYL